jgi:glycerol-3-phosphate dehydrogenase
MVNEHIKNPGSLKRSRTAGTKKQLPKHEQKLRRESVKAIQMIKKSMLKGVEYQSGSNKDVLNVNNEQYSWKRNT